MSTTAVAGRGIEPTTAGRPVSEPPADDRPETLARYIAARVDGPDDGSRDRDAATAIRAAVTLAQQWQAAPEPDADPYGRAMAHLSNRVLRVLAAGLRVLPLCLECRCDPLSCETDETGQHCADRACPTCTNGCPLEHCPVCTPDDGAAVPR